MVLLGRLGTTQAAEFVRGAQGEGVRLIRVQVRGFKCVGSAISRQQRSTLLCSAA